MYPRILIIDDDASMRGSLSDLLSLADFECDTAETGRKGLALFQLHQPDLVVLDMQLPDISGYQVCAIMKKDPIFRKAPIVAISGRFTEPQDKIEGLELGADDYFLKPFDPLLFMSRIKNLMRANAVPPPLLYPGYQPYLYSSQ